MVKRERLRRSMKALVLLLLISLSLFALFSFITIRSDVNIITTAVDTLRGIITEPGNSIDTIRTSIGDISWLVALEIGILAGAVIAALLVINYLLSIYFWARETSYIDELTKLYNKRALFKILGMEVKRAKRFKHPLTIIMLDIDFFKIYNDKNGHVQGDMALKKVARIIMSKIREVDTAARYGGEEFTIILPETRHDEAIRIAERIRKGVEETEFKGESKLPKKNLTISLGLSTFHGEYKGKKRMLQSADEMLYKSKQEGRNMLMKTYFGRARS